MGPPGRIAPCWRSAIAENSAKIFAADTQKGRFPPRKDAPFKTQEELNVVHRTREITSSCVLVSGCRAGSRRIHVTILRLRDRAIRTSFRSCGSVIRLFLERPGAEISTRGRGALSEDLAIENKYLDSGALNSRKSLRPFGCRLSNPGGSYDDGE